MVFKHIAHWYDKYERIISSLSLIGGFVFDAVALKRVDLFIENFWIVVHLLMAAVGIIALNLFEKHSGKRRITENTLARVHFWLIIFIQFSFGGLLSTFLVFYFRSATLAQSWPFLLLLVIAFASNEIFKKQYLRLSFQVSVLFLSIYAFAIFLIPVLVHRIGADIFVLSGAVSIGVILIFMFMMRILTGEYYTKSRKIIFGSIAGLLITINVLYFTNLIPPIPLALKDSGVYHSIVRLGSDYTASAEISSWKDFFHIYKPVHVVEGDMLYVYSAVFSPTNFDTSIIHEWQYYNEATHVWETKSEITLSIHGGRDGGFRTFSNKQVLAEGKWRVDVKTVRGQLIGRINFVVQNVALEPELAAVTLQ